MPEAFDVVVVGAGFAGASTAYHLSRAGVRSVIVLEREHSPGLHASGRNAALSDAVETDPVLAPLAEEGVSFLQSPPEGFSPVPLMSRIGSLRIGSESDLAKLRQEALRCCPGPAAALELLSREEAARRMSLLEGGRFEAALWCPAAGVVDIHALLGAYLRGFTDTGGELRCSSAVTRLRRSQDGTFEIETSAGDRLSTRAVVNGAGAWAGELGRLALALPVPLTPYRRHLFQTIPMPSVDPHSPWVWDETVDFYFRPESGGLLLSACDKTPQAAGEPVEDPLVRGVLAEKVMASVPRLEDLRLARGWACLRTFVPDSRFVIGEDLALPGFFWLAGLGGTGVINSASIGRLAAECVLGSERRVREDSPLSPARFKLCG